MRADENEDRESDTLVEAALRVLKTADPFEKARLGDFVASQWLQGTITRAYDPSLHLSVPDRPARLSNVKLVAPGLMPKLGKAGSLQSRQAIVHSLAHTESWAIDLSWFIPVSLLLAVWLLSAQGRDKSIFKWKM
ncbi:hypothetical protein G2W53_032557 [Senna tora]|uniref:Uncharacterized protein n=1 Tax=Senna tora TaxID=362788 RepID=A0A834WAB6_9FABA|nr:hypothetical protein G2W53_032557 [Senna tora]